MLFLFKNGVSTWSPSLINPVIICGHGKYDPYKYMRAAVIRDPPNYLAELKNQTTTSLSEVSNQEIKPGRFDYK